MQDNLSQDKNLYTTIKTNNLHKFITPHSKTSFKSNQKEEFTNLYNTKNNTVFLKKNQVQKRISEAKLEPELLSKNTKLIINTMLKKKRLIQKLSVPKVQIKKLNIKDLFKEKRVSGPAISCRTPQGTNNWFSLNSTRRLEHTVKVKAKGDGTTQKVIIKRSISPLRSLKRLSERNLKTKIKQSIDRKKEHLKNKLKVPLNIKKVTKNDISWNGRNVGIKKHKEVNLQKKKVFLQKNRAKTILSSRSVDKRISLGKTLRRNQNQKEIEAPSSSNMIHKNSQLRSINKTLQNISYHNIIPSNNAPFPLQKALKIVSKTIDERKSTKLVESNQLFLQTSDCLSGSISVKLGLKIPSNDLNTTENETFQQKSSTFINTAALLQSKNSINFVKNPKNIVNSFNEVDQYEKPNTNNDSESIQKGESILLNNKKFNGSEETMQESVSGKNTQKRVQQKIQNILSFQMENNKIFSSLAKNKVEAKNELSIASKINLILSRKESVSADKAFEKKSSVKQETKKSELTEREIMTFRQDLPSEKGNKENKFGVKNPFETDSRFETIKENPFKQTDTLSKDIQISYLTSQLGNSDSKIVNPIFQNKEILENRKGENNIAKNKKLPHNQELLLEQILETICPITSPRHQDQKTKDMKMTSRYNTKKKRTKNYSQKNLKTFRRKKSLKNKENTIKLNTRKYNWQKYKILKLKTPQNRLDTLLYSYRNSTNIKHGHLTRKEKEPRETSTSLRKKFKEMKNKKTHDQSYSKKISNKLMSLKRNNSLRNKTNIQSRNKSSNRFRNIYKDYYKTMESYRRKGNKSNRNQIQSKIKKDFIKKKLNLL